MEESEEAKEVEVKDLHAKPKLKILKRSFHQQLEN